MRGASRDLNNIVAGKVNVVHILSARQRKCYFEMKHNCC